MLLIVITSTSYAQDSTPSERQMVQQLAQEVKELQEKVKALESQIRKATMVPNNGGSANPSEHSSALIIAMKFRAISSASP